MRSFFKFLPLIVLLAVGYYLYKINWLVTLNADFSVGADGISILAQEMDYHDCKVKLTGEYTGEISKLRRGERAEIPFYKFHQWNGTTLESMAVLDKELEISMRCDEGRRTEEMRNPYANH
jgi:hypothetical protein